jgi:Phosphotransferase enzyme family
MEEEPLGGGNMSAGVVRIGDTVRRPAGPWTPAVHALLEHLRRVGFRGAPRVLGLDAQGREVLEFIPGDVAWPDHFDLLDDERQLGRAVLLIRYFHEAVAGFTPPADARWQVLMPADGDEIIAHHDLAPWNLVIGERQWAFIDWDTAAPGTRLWDLAYAMHGFAPLSADPALQRDDTGRRLRLIADAYGLDERQRLDVIPLLARRTQAMYDFLAREAAAGTQPWARLWREGHGASWKADTAYITGRQQQWHQALLG